MKRFVQMHRRVLNFIVFLLAVLVFLSGLERQIPQVQAHSAAQISQISQSIPVRRRKRHKRRRRKRRRKKRSKRQKRARPVLAMLPFSGDGGGLSMVQAVSGRLGNIKIVDAYQVEMALKPGKARFSPNSIRAALKATGGTVLLRGHGQKSAKVVAMQVYLFDHKGRLRWEKKYQSAAGERDPLALAAPIGKDLQKALTRFERHPVVKDTQARQRDLTIFSDPSLANNDSAAASNNSSDQSRPTAAADSNASASKNSASAADTGSESNADLQTSIKRKSKALQLSVAVGGDMLYWSYQLRSLQFDNDIYAHPLDPYIGSSLSLDWRPFDWLQVDSDLHLGQRSFDSSAAPIDQSQVRITVLNFGMTARARYMLKFGLGLGGHLAYRLSADWASEQKPLIIASNMMQHSFLPGLDIYYEALAPWLLLRGSLGWSPIGLYSENPGEPGQSAQMWGWRADFAARSQLWRGLFVELRAFSENGYVQYSGEGQRQDLSGQNIANAAIKNSLHGISLGAGWIF